MSRTRVVAPASTSLSIDTRSLRSAIAALILLVFVLGTLSIPGAAQGNAGTALQFNGTNQYVTFGAASGLGASTFTIECWFKRTAAGVGTGTGSGGITSAVPLITKGRAEADGDNRDMNYFLGIDATSGKLVADFEEGPSTGGTLGLNHPVSGNTVVTSNVWHHAAATYDGQTWKLYLDGVLDGTLTLTVPRPPRADSIQHAALATAMNSTGVAAGFFAGILDEARIWNSARTQTDIQATMNQEVTSGAGLLDRWGMNEGSGITVGSSIAGGANGTAVGAPPWVPGFPLPDTTPPMAPQNVTGSPGNALVTLVWSENTEADLAGYNVYRSTGSPVLIIGTPVNGSTLVTGTTFTDHSAANGTPYNYAITAVDTSNNVSGPSTEASATPSADAGAALSFNGSNQYVTFGQALGLGSVTFTLETWFRRMGPGAGANTGTGGIADIVPLVSKGRAEADGSNVDMNYILGIQASTNKLAVDFEDMATGGNHPMFGSTAITDSAWHHAAATYDGTTWHLFLDGNPEGSLAVNQTPRYDSIQHAGLATAINSTGVAAGYFQGFLDEARIWNYARTQQQIVETKNFEIRSATGLIARWGMNEATGTVVGNSAGTINGTASNGPEWVAGFPLMHNDPPQVEAGAAQTITLPAAAALSGTVTDDGLPVPPGAVTTTWSKFSGPGLVTFGDPAQLNTSASFGIEGLYTLRLEAFDGALTSSDTVQISVNPTLVNEAPVVSAGSDQTITLPAPASLNGNASDDGLPSPPGTLTVSWTKVGGPGIVTFDNANAAATTANFSVAGVYVLRLSAYDGALTSSADVTITVRPATGNYALQVNGTDGYISVLDDPKLHLSTFTLEAWFRRDANGVGTNTGNGGIASAVPLITKGRAESETATTDINYFLGIDTNGNVLAADFEEAQTGANPSLNHPVRGVTAITNGVWHHAAATYDGSKWQLFLDGLLETELVVGQPPAFASTQQLAIGSALNSSQVASGFLAGVVDEVRVWDHALSGAEIRANMNLEVSSANGLVARWGLNEGFGALATDSANTPSNGTINGGYSWVEGAPFNLNHAPVVNAGPDQTITLPAAASLTGTATDDGLPSPPAAVTIAWAQVSGPGTATFSNPNVAATTATFSSAGIYVLRLTANDSSLSTSDDITVTVNVAVVNQPPVVEAGPDQTITLSTTAALSGTATDDGLPSGALTTLWSKTSGLGTVTFADASATVTTASFSAPGTYVLRLTASDTALSTYDELTVTVDPASGNYALDLNGADAYISIPDATKLHLSSFTVETWFRRDGAGVGTNTGTGGIASAVPLITKGRAESETATVDINYFLGIDTNGNVLAADFEEAQTGASPSLNHPIRGTTPISNGVWHHVAATYDGAKWQLFLDGVLDSQLTVGQPPAFQSTQRVAIGSALNSTNVASGFFAGAIDEVRIWDHALSAVEIQANINAQLTGGVGLVARWGLNEGSGATVSDSLANPATGTIIGSGWNWVSGAPFNVPINHPPNAPVLVAPADGSTGATTSPALAVTASDPDAGTLSVSFYGRPLTSTPGPDFTIAVLPDSQYYTASMNGGTPAMFSSQSQWIADNQAANNIVYAVHEGDITNDGDSNQTEWINANTAMSMLEPGIPYGMEVGNHDQTGGTVFFNQYFGEARFTGRPYYGGHYGSNNNNHYDLFSASGMDFIAVYLEYGASGNSAIMSWANQLLQTYNNRRAIVINHDLLNGPGNPAAFSSEGQAIYTALQANPNLFLMLCGHAPGEGQRADTFNGSTVYTLLADYQSRTNGGSGWMRLLHFSPANNTIHVTTYSPWLNQPETDTDSQFDLSYSMSANTSFAAIGSATIPSGSDATVTWPGLQAQSQYEWYAVASDGALATRSATWRFTTLDHAPVVNVPPARTVAEGLPLTFTVSASDSDGDAVTLSATSLPTGAAFDADTGAFSWTPGYDQAGSYTVSFTATSGTPPLSDAKSVAITVSNTDRPPVLTVPGSQTVAEGALLTFTVSGADPDGDAVTLSATNLPAGASFNPSTGTFSWTPEYNQGGIYNVSFTATSGTPPLSDAKSVAITVSNTDRPPVLTVPGSQTVAEGALLTFTVSGADPDGDSVTLSATNLPAGASFNPSTGTFSWTPEYNQGGSYNVSFTATSGTPPLSSTKSVAITVSNTDRPPVLTVPGPQTVAVGSTLSFTVSSVDPDGTKVSLSASNVPSGATFKASTGVFTWKPTSSQINTFVVTFTASSGGLSDHKDVSITVTGSVISTATSLTSSPNPSNVGQTVTFTATVTSSSGVPTGTVTFKDGTSTLGSATLNGVGVATFQTGSLASGSHTITAVYNGSATFAQSASLALTQVVGNPLYSTTTTLTSSPNPSVVGQSVTFAATVTSAGGFPTGTVTFTEAGTTLGSASMDSSGRAVFATSSLGSGTHSITATYVGSSTFAPSTSVVVKQRVGRK